MKRTNMCLVLFGFAILADMIGGPMGPALSTLEETPTVALAIGPAVFLAYRWFTKDKRKLP